MMRLAGLQAMWHQTRQICGAKFATFMDEVARAPVETDADELAHWAAVEAVKSKARAKH
ncbi:MAG TPA: hypothetical protein VGH02_14050 [Rhizomicrobium sp.]|jgi:DNA primase